MTRKSRRGLLKALGAGAIASVAGCASPKDDRRTANTTSSSSTTTQTQTPPPTDATPLTTTPEPSKLDRQLNTVWVATEKYTDPKKALQDGFKAGGPYVPGMGWHFQHPGRLADAAKNGPSLEKPPILTYLNTDRGLILGAAEFAVPVDAVDDTPDLFADGTEDGATEKWHTHPAATHVFATPDGEQTSPKSLTLDQLTTNDNWAEFRPPNRNLSAGDAVSLNWGTAKGKEGNRTERVADIVSTHPDLLTLHAWVQVTNPEGPFHPVNPRFTDDGGDHHGTSTATSHDH